MSLFFRLSGLLTLILTFQCLALFAQGDFKPGKIVTSDGNSESGLISKKSDNDQCIFRKSSSQEIITYSTRDIKGYSFDGGHAFESKTINGEYTQFIEVLIQGKVRLYKFKSRFFIESQVKDFTELRIVTKSAEKNGSTQEAKFKEYIGVLDVFLNDCPKLTPRLKNTELAEGSLVKLMEEYYKCIGETATTSKTNISVRRTNFSIAGGYAALNWGVNMSENTITFADVQELTTGPSYFFGPSIELSSPRENSKLYFKAELLFIAPTQFVSIETYQTSAATTTLEYIDISHSSIRLPIMVKYEFSQNKFLTPYANIGLSVNSFKIHENIRSTEQRSGNVINIGQGQAFETASMGFSGIVGIGSRLNLSEKFYVDIELRGEIGTGTVKAVYKASDLFPVENNFYFITRFGITKFKKQ